MKTSENKYSEWPITNEYSELHITIFNKISVRRRPKFLPFTTQAKMSRWGIASAGKISHDFVNAVNSSPDKQIDIVAVAARDVSRANEFAKHHKIRHVFESYETLAKSNEIDVAYIGSLNPIHYELTKLFLENGKHVLCEKPLCLNQKQVESLVDLAKRKNLFLMEAVWSRFLPSYLALEKELESGKLGNILYAEADFGVPIGDIDRVAKKELGGSALLDLGVYVLQFAQFVFKDEPIKVTSSGTLNQNGIDESVSIILDYNGDRRAVLNIHTRLQLDNVATVYGTKGNVKLLSPFHCSEHLQTADGKVQEFALHSSPIPFNFQNSSGLAYQSAEVKRCIEKGLIESSRMSHAESLLLAKLEDTIRKQIGVQFDVDNQNY